MDENKSTNTGVIDDSQRGTVSMANLGKPNSNASQFFIAFRPLLHLDGKYTVFGQAVEETLDILDQIEQAKIKKKRPVKPIKVYTVAVEEDPWENAPLPAGAVIPGKPLIDLTDKKACTIQ
mgnify:FL=1